MISYIWCCTTAVEEDDFNEGLILPPLVVQLRKILDQYSDETQIFKVWNQRPDVYHTEVVSRHRSLICLQCFDVVGLASGRAFGLRKLTDGVLVWLSVSKPHHLLPHLNPHWSDFTFLVPAYPGCPGKRGRSTGVVVAS